MNVSIAKLAHVLAIVVFIIAAVGGSISDWNLVPVGLALYVGGDLAEDLLSGD
jgi:hypothetical protein